MVRNCSKPLKRLYVQFNEEYLLHLMSIMSLRAGGVLKIAEILQGKRIPLIYYSNIRTLGFAIGIIYTVS